MENIMRPINTRMAELPCSAILSMERNAGQLPQPFWLYGNRTCSVANCTARS